jgi:hypothetical protein
MPVIPQKPLTPGGGPGDLVSAKLPRGSGAAIDRIAHERGITRSEFVRTVLLAALDAEIPQEVAAQAS